MRARRKSVAKPTRYTYTNKLTGKENTFEQDNSSIVVSLQPNELELESFPLKTFNSILVNSILPRTHKVNLEIGVAVFDGHSNISLNMEEEADKQDEIANSLPALIDFEGNSRYFIPDEFTVQFIEGIGIERIEEILQDVGSEIINRQRTPGYFTLSVPEGVSMFDSIERLNAYDEVYFSEPSEIGFEDELSEGGDFHRLWGLHNTGQQVRGVSGTPGVDIEVLKAWEVTKGDPSVIIAVIDTGVDLLHPDLKDNLLHRNGEDWDFADLDGSPDDGGSHGSHVCGTVAAVSDNSVGVVGVAPNCRVMPLRINLEKGRNQNRADAINYVTSQAQKNPDNKYVINCSWRVRGEHIAVKNAIKRATAAKNVLMVFAAGNKGRDLDERPQYPASYEEVIAVAGLDPYNKKVMKSNYGTKVDVCAPGINIWSTVPPGRYAYKNGTSMATPFVSGVLALIWSINESLAAEEVRSILEETCHSIDDDNQEFQGKLGKGRINAFQAVLKAQA